MLFRSVGISLNGERRTEIAYDEATGRIASMRVAGADEPFRWEYEPGSDLKKTLRYPNGATVEWEYEPHRDLVTLVSNDVYSSYRYEYDAAGRRVAKNDERYEYNVRGELVLATNVVTGAEFAYCYDDIGNRQWSREFGTNCTYVANELNQYTNIVRGGVHELSAFDLDGNQTNVVTATGEWAVEYNGENRPVLWRRKSDGATIRMSYDRMGRRVRKNDETFVYDGYLNISQTIWDPTEPVATRPLVWRGTGGNAFYFHDGNKNVADFVSVSSASTARHYDYAPFGESIGDASVDGSGWQFSSEYVDYGIGLTYYNYRHYCARNGTWLCRDPIYEVGFRRCHLHIANSEGSDGKYSFPDPVNKTDRIGLLIDRQTICCQKGQGNDKTFYRKTDWVRPCCDAGDAAVSDDKCTCFGTARDYANVAMEIGAKYPGAASEGPGDAVRHCVWACLISKKHRYLCSWLVTTGYEVFESYGERMDYENNGHGRDVADSGADCETGCVDLLYQGKLKVENPEPLPERGDL